MLAGLGRPHRFVAGVEECTTGNAERSAGLVVRFTVRTCQPLTHALPSKNRSIQIDTESNTHKQPAVLAGNLLRPARHSIQLGFLIFGHSSTRSQPAVPTGASRASATAIRPTNCYGTTEIHPPVVPFSNPLTKIGNRSSGTCMTMQWIAPAEWMMLEQSTGMMILPGKAA